MADNTKIEWADATLNYVNGCTRVSPGCGGPGPHGGCYAERLAGTRLRNHPSRAGLTKQTSAGPRWTGEVLAHEPALLQALSWKRGRRIFWNAHGDLFHENVPDAWIDRLFAGCALTPQHIHMILTKRSERMLRYCADPRTPERIARVILDQAPDWGVRGDAVLAPLVPRPAESDPSSVLWPLPNVWLGVSVEDQIRANERIPDLLRSPAAVRFISAEPLLGPVDLSWIEFPSDRGGEECWDALDLHPIENEPIPEGDGAATLDWVIVGGESGPNARPMHPEWVRTIRNQCAAAGVAFLFKQWGEWIPLSGPDGFWPHNTPGACRLMTDGTRHPRGNSMQRVGKKAAGRLLDGVEHTEFPA